MRICHFIASSKFGGAERVVINLCNQLAKEYHDVHLVVFAEQEVLLGLSDRVNLHTIREFKRYNLLAMRRLATLIQNIDPDIVNTHGAKATRIVFNIKKRLPCPYVGTKHNARKGRIFNDINYVIAVSQEVKRSVRHQEVKVIYNGIEPVSMDSRTDHNIFTILAVGRLDKIKGFDILIRECAKLDFPFLLKIIGNGEEKKRLQSLISSLKMNDKVELLGFREDIPQQMHHADIVVMSSHSEGFSLVMVESLFYANIFISTKVSGATEILDDRFLIDGFHIADKLNEVYRNQNEYKEKFKRLRERMNRRFLLKNIAKEYTAYYKEIIRKST